MRLSGRVRADGQTSRDGPLRPTRPAALASQPPCGGAARLAARTWCRLRGSRGHLRRRRIRYEDAAAKLRHIPISPGRPTVRRSGGRSASVLLRNAHSTWAGGGDHRVRRRRDPAADRRRVATGLRDRLLPGLPVYLAVSAAEPCAGCSGMPGHAGRRVDARQWRAERVVRPASTRSNGRRLEPHRADPCRGRCRATA